jgi:hypothetical protein
MRSHDVRTDAGGEKKIASIPYIPMPYRQETFGSWIWRCSRAYCTSRSAFMRFILATAGAELIDAPTDWDTDPPLAFLTALTSVAPLQLSELTNLVVLKGPATLAPAYRDAYCPQCFREDEVRGTIHMRRAWLDAWTIECPRHECILGRFSGFECKDSAGRITNFPTRFGREPTDEGQVRDNPVVCEVPLPQIRLADTARSENGRGVKRWFDSVMLDSVVGRDLMVMAGSDYPCLLYRGLFGCDQSWKQVWHDTDNQALQWPNIHHPLGTIGMRIPAAYLAALIWNCLYQRPESAAYADRVVQSVREFLTLRWLREPERRFAHRWPREERDRWLGVFGKLSA